MKFSNVIILAVILGGGYSYLFPKNAAPTPNEVLITQFDKHDVVKRSEWRKGNVIDGVQIYSVRKDYAVFQSIWSLGRDEAGVMVLTEGKEPKIEAAFALNQCNQLASAVIDTKTDDTSDAVFSVFQKALSAEKDNKGVLRATGEVGGKSYDVSARVIDSVLTFSCGIKST
ncbi:MULTISPECIES: hypothetical protein [Klebsiella/Raoultella group]|uniref:hypothetical protein n=1 Tax=Klebsiella/Raoultella group TaxID=2890311 RepID=UPI0006661093|nr:MULTISPECIES: hypothetical protein [Klebsiella]MBC4221139.1 hypothetical protein [Klebsiella pneumoniae]PAT27410.1 hypothetical protein CJ307_00750 [Klebsiella quasipneumoniae]HCB1317930.1 hypothetical protein [Klebsiella variicola subsp. variicola]EGT0065550.1 hypothetical protein [Klebsiella michiganensis]MBZ7337507.1 hypothetical protein [Klebsiella grimontii]